MRIPSLLMQSILLPVASWRSGNAFMKEYRLLRESQSWSSERLNQLQRQRLQALLAHAFATVPFYHEWLGDHRLTPEKFGDPANLELLPVLTKKEIQTQPMEKMISSRFDQSELIPYSTSGSSGEPFRFMTCRGLSGHKIARYFREMEAWGIAPGVPFLKVWGAGRVPAPGHEKEASLFSRWILQRHEELAFDLDQAKTLRLLELLQRKQFPVLEAYASTALHLAKTAMQHGLNFPALRCVVVSGETLTEQHRSIIQTGFGAGVLNAYGSREFGRVAFSLPGRSELYFSCEDFYAEYLDLPGDPRDARKRLILTCFSNLAQPFIRYDTGDLAIPETDSERSRECGLPVWREVSGRLSEQVVLPDGRHLSVHFFTLFLEDLQDEIAQFQVVVHSQGEITLLLCPGPKFSQLDQANLAQRIAQEIGAQVLIRVVDKIPMVGDGKQPLLRHSSEPPS